VVNDVQPVGNREDIRVLIDLCEVLASGRGSRASAGMLVSTRIANSTVREVKSLTAAAVHTTV
jgi:hypothetical protein